MMDGQKVEEENYTLEEGSTIVTFNANYLESLSIGEHTITLVYKGENSINHKVTIFPKKIDSDTDNAHDADNNEPEGTFENKSEIVTEFATPSTGDSSNLLLWIMMMLGATGICGFFTWRVKRQN